MVLAARMPRFQVHAIAHDDNAVEGQSRLGAIPGDKLIDGVLVHPPRGARAEAIEDGQFAMIQIWQPKHSAAVIRLDSLFMHSDGPPCRSTSDHGRSPAQCNIRSLISLWVLLATGAIFRLRFDVGCRTKCLVQKKTGWRS